MSAGVLQLPAALRWIARPSLLGETGLTGHVLAVLVWRADCAQSRAALVELAAVAAAFVDQPCAMLSICIAADGDALRQLLDELPVPIPTALADDLVWLRQLGVRASPWLLLADADGRVRASAAGVPRRARLRSALSQLLAGARPHGTTAPFVAHRARTAAPARPRAAVCDGKRLWVAFADGHRLAAFDLADGVAATALVGSGEWGAEDGAGERASLACPVDMAVHGDQVLLTDAGSHTVRAVDRASLAVSTICGTGLLGGDEVGGGYGRDQALHSPSAVAVVEQGLIIANAGTEQLWQVDAVTGAAMAWLDGFCEPLGLAVIDDTLWVAEGSAGRVRAVDLGHARPGHALAGFERPVAVAAVGAQLLVADERACCVVACRADGGGRRTWFDAGHGLRGPLHVTATDDRVFVVDRAGLFEADLDERGQPGELRVRSLAPPAVAGPANLALVAEPVEVGEYSDVNLRIPVGSPAASGSWSVDVLDEAAATLSCARHADVQLVGGALDVLLPVAGAGEGAWRVRATCGDDVHRFVVPVRVCAGGAQHVVVRVGG